MELGLFLVQVSCYNIYEMSKQSKKLTILYVLKILKDGAESLQTMIDFLITQS
jgi:molybdenum cofactor biosynthesis enzyme